MLIHTLVSFLIAAGVLLCLWCLFGWFLLPFGEKDLQLLLRVSGDAKHLERQVRALSWLKGSGLLKGRLVILDCGLNQDGQNLVYGLCHKYDVFLKLE